MIKLFISSLAFYTSLSHPHPGWIYVGTPAPTMPGGIAIANPNVIPPMTHPNNNPPQGVIPPNIPIPPPGVGIPSVPIPPDPTQPNPWTSATSTTTTAQPVTNLIPVQPIMPPVTPVTTSAASSQSTTNGGAQPIAPVAQSTTLTPGTNTISTTAKAVTTTPPVVVPPGIPPGPPATNPGQGTGPGTIPGLPFFETTSTGAPATGTGPVTTAGSGSTTAAGGPSIIPPPWINTLNPGQLPVIPVPGLPGQGTPQPTPFPTTRPTTPAPIMPTMQPTTGRPTPQPTPYPTTPAPIPPLPGHQYGAWRQNCPLPLGTEQCTDITDIVTDQTGNNANAGVVGQLTCNAANDCCLCESIHCGSVGGNSCTSLTLSGEKAAYGVQDINAVVGPASGTPAAITCSGLESCKLASIRGNFISSLSCIGRFGCHAAEIVINNPAPGFALECGVTSACENARITLNFLPPAGGCDTTQQITDLLLGAISCIGVNGCRGMEFTINNMGCDNVILESIECRLDTCADAQFNFYGTSAIGIQSCELPANGAQPNGIERCFSQLRSLSCPDPGSCMNQQRTLIDPINGFMLSCESEMSCMNAQYTIQITSTQFSQPTEQINVQCNAVQSCQNARFEFTNDNVTPLYVEAGCNAERSCAGTTFITGPNVFLFDVDCGSPELCYGCTLNGQPCGGHYGSILPPQYVGPPQFPNIPPVSIPNIPPNPNNNFPQFPVQPTFPQNPNTLPINPVPQFPVNPNPVSIPVFPSVPSPPLADPWAQPNPWASGPSFNPNPNPLPIDPWAQPQPQPIFPDPIPVNPAQPANPSPPLPDPWAVNPNPIPPAPIDPIPPNPAQPAPIDPWAANPVQPAPIDPWAQPNPVQPAPIDPWAQPAPIDPWAQPNPFPIDPFAPPSFSNVPNPNPIPDPWANPNPIPDPWANPNSNTNPVTTLPPNQQIPTFNQPAAPAPPQNPVPPQNPAPGNSIPPPVWPTIPDPWATNPVQPAPIDPWTTNPNPPQPPIDPWTVNPVQPAPIDPWAQPAQPNPFFTPWDPFAPPTFSNVPNTNQQGPSFSFGQPGFPQNPGPWII